MRTWMGSCRTLSYSTGAGSRRAGGLRDDEIVGVGDDVRNARGDGGGEDGDGDEGRFAPYATATASVYAGTRVRSRRSVSIRCGVHSCDRYRFQRATSERGGLDGQRQ